MSSIIKKAGQVLGNVGKLNPMTIVQTTAGDMVDKHLSSTAASSQEVPKKTVGFETAHRQINIDLTIRLVHMRNCP